MGIAKNLLKAGYGRDDAIKTGRFLLFFLLAYVVLSAFFYGVIGLGAIELWVANNVLGILQAFGQAGFVSFGETAFISLDSGPVIEISELCTGLTETMIIVSAILVSLGISWRRRLLGATVGGLATIALNHARIAFTVLLILGSEDVGAIAFTHDILFRIFLFAAIAGIYIAWFYWAMLAESKKEKRLNR